VNAIASSISAKPSSVGGENLVRPLAAFPSEIMTPGRSMTEGSTMSTAKDSWFSFIEYIIGFLASK
jgi:hypothetical protein